MELLRELTALQHEQGWLDDGQLRDMATRRRVPLYRLEGLVSFYPHFRRVPPARTVVHVCRDVTCAMRGCGPLTQQLRAQFANSADVEIQEMSCLGRCDAAPAVVVNEIPLAPTTLADVETVTSIIDGTVPLPDNAPTTTPRQWKCNPYASAAAHYETVRALASSSQPSSENGGLAASCIERLKGSGLRGMGGAGFPTGLKWELVSKEAGQPKYVICNADESEPGTFKDRVILEELPHLVIEGMLLAGLTIGAEHGIVYLRHEYSKEHQALETALQQARAQGVLGENAAGSGQRFEIEVFLSPGGYILGEETALLEALEDKRGEPRNKPPYPGTHGLWGRPTLINNVESFALATSIIHHGVEWWQSQASADFAGLKFASISGDVERPGVYEIPVGTTVSQLIEIAGGLKDGTKLQAFLPGGASSNFLPADKVDTPLDFDAMKAAGSMLGTGAVIVIGAEHDLYDMAVNIVRFFRNESCGKCVPCRVGSEKAVNLLEDVQAGSQPAAALDVLTDLGETLTQTSICGLGQVALNPILSMLKHFPNAVP